MPAPRMETDVLSSESILSYWSDLVLDTEACIVPESGHRSDGADGGVIDISLSSAPLIQSLYEEHGVTAQAVFLTAWALVLRYYISIDSIYLAHSIHEPSSLKSQDGSTSPRQLFHLPSGIEKRDADYQSYK
jgi:hypothetical protein